jgi:tetratricopeptide (TPR) repeat protein
MVYESMDMNIQLLTEINSALWTLVYLVGSAVSLYIIKTVIVVYRTYKKIIENKFQETASVFFENGDYKEVVQLCEKQINEKPNDAYGYWYMGKAQFELGNYEVALTHFNKAAEIYPSWVKEWVQPYYEKIEKANQNANK